MYTGCVRATMFTIIIQTNSTNLDLIIINGLGNFINVNSNDKTRTFLC
jgi:hypothetical protein